MRVVFVHGACALDADWWWHRMVEPLAALGLDSRSVELPSCGERAGAGPGADLHADADAVRAVLDEEPGHPALLCGHSYGGMVITDAAAGRDDVAQLLYVTAVVPDSGESIASLAGPEPAPWVVPREDGTVVPNTAADLRGAFLHDRDEEATEGAFRRLGPQSQAALAQAPRGIARHDIPSTYVVCAEDRATPPVRQREFARRASTVIDLPTGHHPFLSHPALPAEVIGGVVPG
ncbi:alpha/beta fold hydrolase [Streptomyces spongiae]|uniref:Alpha/beta hydrolase n=1 Tax=Streptomyces spongiae TaxID=565072 RepID=A0A5N8XJG4_9ACTN|nr:alpha/beta hydrolase [Streptomyces spongiae]MPY59118.1 alpha/beta hydrolase [Streptomyces spongiae]